jgi:hypothetical protein
MNTDTHCTIHRLPLVKRRNRLSGNHFLGCPLWSDPRVRCDYTVPLVEPIVQQDEAPEREAVRQLSLFERS